MRTNAFEVQGESAGDTPQLAILEGSVRGFPIRCTAIERAFFSPFALTLTANIPSFLHFVYRRGPGDYGGNAAEFSFCR